MGGLESASFSAVIGGISVVSAGCVWGLSVWGRLTFELLGRG
jgi:hypothetical protein